MGDPVRKPSDLFPSSPGDIIPGDMNPRDLGSGEALRSSQDENAYPRNNPKDPSLFGDHLPEQTPLLESNPWVPPASVEASPKSEAPMVAPRPKQNRRRGFSFTLLIFGAIGLVAFGAGASLAYFVLSGALDLDQSWIKENLNVIKDLIKDWRR